MKGVTILGTGHALPNTVITNDDLATIVETSDEWIFERTGIRTRHVLMEETLLELSEKAAKDAISMAGLEIDQIDLILAATFTTENAVPGLASMLAGKLEARCPAFDINAACSGFMFGLHTALQYINAGSAKNVLVLGAEALSKVTNWKDRNTCVLFGDGVGAAVVGNRDDGDIMYTNIATEPDLNKVLFCPGINSEVDYSMDSYVRMDGPKVYKFATRVLSKGIKEAMAKLGIGLDKIDVIVPHQANLRIIEGAAKQLNLDMDKFYCNMDHCGNTSSASVPIALSEAVKVGKIKRGDLVVMSAFGGGFSHATCVLQF